MGHRFPLAGENGCKMIHIVHATLLVFVVKNYLCLPIISSSGSIMVHCWEYYYSFTLFGHIGCYGDIPSKKTKRDDISGCLLLGSISLGSPLFVYRSFQLWYGQLFAPQGAPLLEAQMWRGYHTQYVSHFEAKDQWCSSQLSVSSRLSTQVDLSF